MGRIVIAADAVRYDQKLGARRAAARQRRVRFVRAGSWLLFLGLTLWSGLFVVRHFEEAVRKAPDNPQTWVRLGYTYLARLNPAAANGSRGVARLLSPADKGWRTQPVDNVPDAVSAVNITNDAWIGSLAGRAEEVAAFPVAERLFARARTLNPSNPAWPRGVERARAFEQVRSKLDDDQQWTSLGDRLRQSNDLAASEAAYAVARLLKLQRPAGAQRRPRLSTAPVVIKQLGITDTKWLERLGRAAVEMDAIDAAEALFSLAASLEPTNKRWPALVAEAKLKARFPSSFKNGQFWGALGDAYAAQAALEQSRYAYAAAHLVDPSVGQWATKAAGTTPVDGVNAMKALNVRDDVWVRSLAEAARARGDGQAEQALLQFAYELNPKAAPAPATPGANAPVVERSSPVVQVPPPAVVATAEPAAVVTPPRPTPDTTSTPPAAAPSPANVPPATQPARPQAPAQPPPPPAPAAQPATAPTGPPFRLTVRAPYPVMMTTGGRVSQAARTHEVSLASGLQTVIISAPQVFLRRQLEVNAETGRSLPIELQAPLAVRVASIPADCTLSINGIYAGTLPRTLSVLPGPNRFDCEWPSNRTASSTVNVTANGQQIFVTASN